MIPDSIAIDWQAGDDPAALRDREWLATNGLGGFSSASLLGIGTRRYHGLFVPNLTEPKGRHILISRFDEEINSNGEDAVIGGAEYLDGHLHNDVHQCLRQFRWHALMPTWIFEIGGQRIEKTIVMPHNQNTVCVHYRLLQGRQASIKLRPFVAFRRQDATLVPQESWPFTLSFSGGRYEISQAHSDLVLRMRLHPGVGVFSCDSVIGLNALYRVEQVRGYDHSEHLFSLGYFSAELTPEQPLTFIASTEAWETLQIDGAAAVQNEQRRVEALLSAAPERARHGFAGQLVAAADQFIVTPGSRMDESRHADAAGNDVRTVIAGYHWFGDWGRDTMISLEGLTLCTGRFAEARSILLTFSRYFKDGLLPNLFPEGAREAKYHTVDATLWYFHALDRYIEITGDRDLLREVYPILWSVVDHHLHGTHFNIGIDPGDGLLRAGAPGYQLTWMDAKVDDWVVTPRRGKPVEIQALWYNALCLMAEWQGALGEPGAPAFRDHAQRAGDAFSQRYWNEVSGCLFDVVDGEAGDDPACRPNQLFALSLKHPILAQERWKPVLSAVRQQLLTGYGLRTLAPGHPDYKANYQGDLRARDAAYHQGTVWPWLIGHFANAFLRVYNDRAALRGMLAMFPAHLREAGVGSISEIFDAEAPFVARGCIAQAWSVAEVLRAWMLSHDSYAD